MLKISHRGNLFGKNPNKENSPPYILEALNHNFDVEVDVWSINNEIFLGHDQPTYSVPLEFLNNKKFWCHAKNIEALELMLTFKIHCFWHQEDDVTLTSNRYIWTYPGKKIIGFRAIAVMPEVTNSWDISKAYGVCSDLVGNI